MSVVVIDVAAQYALELPAAAYQEPVEAVAADRADPAFGERVRLRRARRGAEDLDGLVAEDLVEGAAEFTVVVVDQEPGRCRCPGSDQASCLACGLSSVRRGSRCSLQNARAG